jgi:hypothetical protein
MEVFKKRKEKEKKEVSINPESSYSLDEQSNQIGQ